MLNFLFSLFSSNQAAVLNEAFINFIQTPSVQIRDVLDIFIVAILVFLVLTLIKRTKAIPMFIGFILLGAVYALSLALQLRLTETIFGSLLSVILIILAIVFQRELRRFFEFIGLFGLKRRFFTPGEPTIKTIIQAVCHLAERRIGALIVFPGQENIYRHLEGGVLLGGKLSFPLLLSIFDPSSPGHDGAAIIENETIRKFAAHLPLAENIEIAKQFGTRHRAALGLAERTDAFAIVVSEEKGTISVAYNKNLKTLKNDGELELELRNFFDKTFPARKSPAYKRWFRQNTIRAIVSILIAFSLWLIFTYQISFIQKKLVIPIEFKGLSKDYVVDAYTPDEISVIFSGLDRDFRSLDPATLKTLVNLSGMEKGWHRIDIKKESINYPSAVNLVKIEPENIKIHISLLNNPPQ